MIQNKTIGVVIPAYNENGLIEKVLTTMPEFVDYMITVNDGSIDNTLDIIKEYKKKDSRIVLVNHENNKGLGQTLIDGYLKSLDMKIDITAVMAGDAQMDPYDLINVVTPIANEKADYVKGNRLLREDVYSTMPRYRLIGNAFLTLLTKFATGYWHIIDPQCGYTAISYRALKSIDITSMIKGYGYNADILNMLNLKNFKVKDVEVRPVYGDEKSKIKLWKYIPSVSKLLFKLYHRRMIKKYLIREFHPLIFFYSLASLCIFPICIPLLVRFFYMFIKYNELPKTTATIFMFSIMMGLFSFYFGMWLDMEDNKKLKGDN